MLANIRFRRIIIRFYSRWVWDLWMDVITNSKRSEVVLQISHMQRILNGNACLVSAFWTSIKYATPFVHNLVVVYRKCQLFWSNLGCMNLRDVTLLNKYLIKNINLKLSIFLLPKCARRGKQGQTRGSGSVD